VVLEAEAGQETVLLAVLELQVKVIMVVMVLAEHLIEEAEAEAVHLLLVQLALEILEALAVQVLHLQFQVHLLHTLEVVAVEAVVQEQAEQVVEAQGVREEL
jgi:hypothetical protein